MARDRVPYRAVVGLLSVLVAAACGKKPEQSEVDDIEVRRSNLVQDRVVKEVIVYSRANQTVDPTVTLLNWDRISELLDNLCHADLSDERPLCTGHMALRLALSVKEEVVQASTATSSDWSLSESGEFDPTRSKVYKISVPTASDSATWALWATERFKKSAADVYRIESGARQGTLGEPYYNPEMSWGTALSTRYADALTSMIEAQELAQKFILAAAAARRGNTSLDQQSQVTAAWRDPHDSRLEAVTLLGAVTPDRFESVPPGIGNADRLLPVAVSGRPTRGEKRAEEILRSTGVSPCLVGMSSWCRGQTHSNATALAQSLASSLTATQQGTTSLGWQTLLRKRGISLEELERAAHRIVDQAHVLGQAIVPDPESTSIPRVLGTSALKKPASPYYLYVQTLGNPSSRPLQSVSMEDGYQTLSTRFDNDEDTYLASSTAGMAAYVAQTLRSTLAWLGSSQAPYVKVIAETAAYAETIATDHQLVLVERNLIGISRVKFERRGLKFATAAEAAASCNVWRSEAGLECGLERTIGGRPCDATWADRYKIPSSDTAWTVGTTGTTSVMITSSVQPSPVESLALGEHLYVVCDVNHRREVVFAAEVAHRSGALISTGIVGNFTPPLSKTVLDALSDGLGADPFASDESARSCSGVPYDTKVALEDELTEALTGQDGIESSFSYYLKLARQAADKADDLGEKLVDHGLQMDIRAEAAREELEDLCGGVVNVEQLEHDACASHNCNLFALLESTQTSPDLEGIRKCLGLSERPVWAALGADKLCVWQYFPPPMEGTTVSVPAPPFVCPRGVTACDHLSTDAVILPPGGTCAAAFGTSTSLRHLAERPEPGANIAPGVVTWPITETLGLELTSPPPADPPRKQCVVDLAALRGPGTIWTAELGDPSVVLRPPWLGNSAFLRQSTLQPIGDAIGYQEDIYGNPTVTVSGRPWLRLGDRNTGPYPLTGVTKWPCRPHSALATPADNWQEAIAQRTLLNHRNSLFMAGEVCSDDNPATWDRLAQRMRNAVVALKGMTGARFDNVTGRRFATGPVSILDTASMFENGNIPSWYKSSNNQGKHFVSRDGNRMVYSSAEGQVQSVTLGPLLGVGENRVGRTTLSVLPAGEDRISFGSGGWLDPVVLWNSDANCSLGDDGKVRGCADIHNLIVNGGWNVRSEVEYDWICPSVPEEDAKKKVMLVRLCAPEPATGAVVSQAQIAACNKVSGQWMYGDAKSVKFDQPDGSKCVCLREQGPVSFVEAVRKFHYQEEPKDTAYTQLWTDMKKYMCGARVVMGTSVSRDQAIDAFELACAVSMSGAATDCRQDLSAANVEGEDDFPSIRARVQCAANETQKSMSRFYIADIPKQAIEAIRQSKAAQTFPAFRGKYGQEVATLAGQLTDLLSARNAIETAMRDIVPILDKAATQASAIDLNIKSSEIEAIINSNMMMSAELSRRIENIRTRQAIAQQVTSCAVSAASIAGEPTGIGGRIAAAAATCANSALQITSEVQISNVQDKISTLEQKTFEAIDQKIALGVKLSEEEKTLVWQQVSMDITKKIDDMQAAMIALTKAQTSLQVTLASMDSTRNAARRAAAKVLLLGNDDLQRAYGVNASMRARMDTLLHRYGEARDNALSLAFLARRAVEQRLGVDLTSMEDEMTLVPAPRSWVEGLCDTTGIDYSKIRKGEGTTENEKGKSIGYAREFIGDWLTKLENLVESYRIDYPFQDGGDTAIVSIRDEIKRAKVTCDIPGWNLLFRSDGRSNFAETNPVTSDVAWEFTCGGSRQAHTVARDVEHPFTCDDNLVGNCRALGEAKATWLYAVPSACAATTAATTGNIATTTGVGASSGSLAIPNAGLVYWFSGRSCSDPVVGVNYPKVCDDKSGNNRTANWDNGVGTGRPRIVPVGIGGKPSVELPAATRLYLTSGLPNFANEYTYTLVLRRGEVGTTNWTNEYLRDGLRGTSRSYFGNTHRVGENRYVSSGYWDHALPETRYYYLSTLHPIAPQAKPAQADIYTTRSGPQGVEQFVNGVRTAFTPRQAAIPTKFTESAGLWNAEANADPVWLAESVAYSRRLSDEELALLHKNIAQEYQIDTKKPVYWLSGDALARMRTGDDTANSGYVFGPVTSGSRTLRDAANGSIPWQFGTGMDTAPLVTLGGHSALRFDGVDDAAYYTSLAFRNERAATGGVHETGQPADETKDYTVTVVATCTDTNRVHRIWGSLLSSTANAGAGPYLFLEVNGSNGAVQYTNTQTNVTRRSSDNAVSCNGTPFILTLHGNSMPAPAGSMELLVNGMVALQGPQAGVEALNLMPVYGGQGGVNPTNFRGDLAEALIHLHPMTTEDVRGLHVQLGAKYSMAVAGPATAGAAVAVGPARLRQSVSVTPGDYWVSWHQKSTGDRLTLHVDLPNGQTHAFTPTGGVGDTIIRAQGATPEAERKTDLWLAPDWVRHYRKVTVTSAGQALFGFGIPASATSDQTAIAFAAPQVQRAEENYSAVPKEYFPTDATLSGAGGKCEDKDGDTFRTLWQRGCEFYCPPGLGTTCAEDGFTKDVPQRCYYELKFPLSLEEIEKGVLLPAAGFARGNFNYRFDQLAVNFVGTGVKSCEGSEQKAACYAGNFLQYSLRHGAPYRIRNYDGDVVEAPLFAGNVQQAKGLLAERYVTNPISSADESLLKNYWREEFRGRPIDGNFALRVYEDEGVDFEALEDVQLLLHYRYWTRFER